MKIDRLKPPRYFVVSGDGVTVTISDCGRMHLEPDEQVTFVTLGGGEYDVLRKQWGFYATPSTNGRLRSYNLRTALVVSSRGKLFVMLVESGKEDSFLDYLKAGHQRLLCWLDDDATVDDLAKHFGQKQSD